MANHFLQGRLAGRGISTLSIQCHYPVSTSIQDNSSDNRSTGNGAAYLHMQIGIYGYSMGSSTSNGSCRSTRPYSSSTGSNTSTNRAGTGPDDRSMGSSTSV